MRRVFSGVMGCGLALAFFANSAIGQNYTAQQTSAPPTIDGVIDAGEWDNAANEVITQDGRGSAFRFMWDDDALYGLVTTDHTGDGNTTGFLSPLNDNYQWDKEINWNYYFDPNRDGEDLSSVANNAVDGYQIAVHTYDTSAEPNGSLSCSPCTDPESNGKGFPDSFVGTFSEGHIDSLWGNQSEWAGMRTTEIAMVNDNTNGGVSEIKIPWADLDAPGGETGDTGLNLDGVAPVDGEVWQLNVSYVYPNDQSGATTWTPIWVGGTPFAEGPHGTLTFAASTTGGLVCDFDGNEACDAADIDALVADIAAGSNTGTYDLSGDGSVTTADRDAWLVAAGDTAGAFLVGDQDLSGGVDSTDLGLLLNNFGADGSYTGGDLDGSGGVDSTDLGLLLNNFGQNSMPAAAVAVPEPASNGVAMLLGLALLGGYYRARRKA